MKMKNKKEEYNSFILFFMLGIAMVSLGLVFNFSSREMLVGFGFLLCLTSILAFVTRLYEYLVG